jgi:hypothetical protein
MKPTFSSEAPSDSERTTRCCIPKDLDLLENQLCDSFRAVQKKVKKYILLGDKIEFGLKYNYFNTTQGCQNRVITMSNNNDAVAF